VGAFVPPKWRKPVPLGYGNAVDAVGTVAAPLLAGFSLASAVVVVDDATNFRWPGAAVLALALAAILLITAVQCAFNGRQYLWSAADVSDWWPDLVQGSRREELLRAEQERFFHRWESWVKATRLTYNAGIFTLLASLALVLPPLQGVGSQETLRWVATGIASAACVGEAAWIAIGSRRR